MSTKLPLQVRWLIRRDMPEVMAIEAASFEHAWTDEDFLFCLRERNVIGMVAEYNHCIVGFMVYGLHRGWFRLLNFAVDPEFRRCGVGATMVAALKHKIDIQRRTEIVLDVRETNLVAQVFFKKMGFKAVRVLRSHYDDTAEDAYEMRFTRPSRPPYSEACEGRLVECEVWDE